MSSGFLHRYFLNNGGKRLHKWFHYFDVYERHFERFRGKAPLVIEIGVFGGGSLAMWREYFGRDCRVVGLDINPECKQHEAEGIDVQIGSQADPDFLKTILDKYGAPDIVIDDGSHRMAHMRASFDHLYHHLNPTGVYLVEDTHTCYMPKYGGGLKAEGSFMEFVKDKLDEINAPHTAGQVPVSQFTRSTKSISIYDSVIVFERAPQGKRRTVITEAL
ncbi:class I SAM-dependent methyltransferase [Jiella endophytica]|uniref:Class I SAM-dependent methyltransferase n=1 Tax=Jiella endophytica TaxID=2558362 RepID=A0A4Y8RQ25_9HYPH|nr:class I SAM-dependent methyltransferase [Jiella endophytica]TFF25175.1 class I SAM-dependent methyltransferase [Jiella endophytica]